MTTGGRTTPSGDAASLEELQEMFKGLDLDNSGTLERPELEELMKMLGEPAGRVDDLFARADSDGDGEISFEEFKKVFRDGEDNVNGLSPVNEREEDDAMEQPNGEGLELAVAKDVEEGAGQAAL